MTNLINCGTCGYPLAPEERTTLVEKDGVMVKPAREWVGLTDEQIDSMYLAMLNDKREFDGPRDSLVAIVRAIEAAHGITGEKK